MHLSQFRIRSCAAVVTLIVATAVVNLRLSSARACWADSNAAVRYQLSRSSQWGIVHILGRTYSGLRKHPDDTPGIPAQTHVQAELVDVYGQYIREVTFVFEGADTEGGVVPSSMPNIDDDSFYMVFLRQEGGVARLVSEGMSVVRVENAEPGKLSPWDSVHFGHARSFMPPGATRAVSDAQLFEVMDSLALIEQEIVEGRSR